MHEPRVKVDLTKYVEHHAFSFDDVLDEEVTNDAVYRSTVQPLVATIFRSGKVCPPVISAVLSICGTFVCLSRLTASLSFPGCSIWPKMC